MRQFLALPLNLDLDGQLISQKKILSMRLAEEFWIYYQVLVILGTLIFASCSFYIALKIKRVIVPTLRSIDRSLKLLKTAKIIEERRRRDGIYRSKKLS